MNTVLPPRGDVEELYKPLWGDTVPYRQLAVGDGWLGILRDLAVNLVELDPDARVLQVKEKFGGLRVYMTSQSQLATDIVRGAEAAAALTCDVCGGAGVEGERNGWWSVRCQDDAPEGWVIGTDDDE